MDYPNGTCTSDLLIRESLKSSSINGTLLGADEEENDGASRMAIGIAMGIFGSVGINVGQNGQAASIEKKRDATGERNTMWWWYTGLFALAATTNFVAFGFAPTTVLAPLEAFQFVSNFVWNYVTKNPRLIKNGKRSRRFNRLLRGTVTVGLGILGPVLATPVSNITLDVETLKCMWTKLPWILYLATTGLVCIVFAIIYRIKRAQSKTIGSGELMDDKSTDRLEQTLYAIPAATVGGFAVANAKIISILLEIYLKDGVSGFADLFSSWFSWMILAFVAFGFAVWLVLLNLGPELYDKLTVIPLLQGAYIVFSSTSGGIYFEDFLAFEAWRHILYWSGVLVIMLGLFQLVPPEDNLDLYAVKAGALFMPILISLHEEEEVKLSRDNDSTKIPMIGLHGSHRK